MDNILGVYRCRTCRQKFIVPVPTSLLNSPNGDMSRERAHSNSSFSEYLSLALFSFMIVWLVLVQFALMNSVGGCIV
jgi:hypothetical protein